MANMTEQLMASLKEKAKAKGKEPFAGKEKRKSRKSGKLPVPPPKQAASAAPIADPKKEGIPAALQVQNRQPLSPEQKARVEEIMTKSRGASPEERSKTLRSQQKASAAEAAKAKRAAKKEKAEAAAAGKTTAMPLTGKAALRAIAGKAIENGAPITKVPAGQKGKVSLKATAAKKAEAEKAKAGKAEKARKQAKRAGSTRGLQIADTATIKVLVKENPKRKEAAKRFALYRSGMSFADYVKAQKGNRASARADALFDLSREWISITPAPKKAG